MLFKKNRNVPANTTAAAPDWQKLQIAKGTLVEWIIINPPECADLMQFKVEYHGVPVFPFSPDEWIYGLTEPIVIRDNLLIDTPPYELDIYAINSSLTNTHEYNIHVNIMPKKAVSPTVEEASFWEKMKGHLGME